MRCVAPTHEKVGYGLLCLALVALLGPADLNAQTAHPLAPDAGCVQSRGVYTCNSASLQMALDRAHTIAIETGHMDRAAAHELRHLATSMGKLPEPAGSQADLTLRLEPAALTGINMGPADHDLATLRIFAPGTTGTPVLLWVETLRGQGDRPWPAQVHALIEQFQAHIKPAA